jgi:hypothetical protein
VADIAIDSTADERQFAADNDALHILPLAYIPLRTHALRRARLIKNSRLEGVVELFSDRQTGSGQCYPTELEHRFRIEHKPDIRLIQQLADLASYDVYSLRTELRRLGIKVDEHACLRLSAGKQAALAPYMASYVRPLLVRIYGKQTQKTDSLGDIVKLFRTPDVETARRNLQDLATKLNVDLDEVPGFIESYGDVYLSLSYYQSCLDEAVPAIKNLLAAIDQIRKSASMRSEVALHQACDFIENRINNLITEMNGLTEMFRARTRNMWDQVSPQGFRSMQAMIQGYQTKVGGNLCIVTAKTKSWSKHFPVAGAGTLSKKASVMMSDIRPGFERITRLEHAGVSRSTQDRVVLDDDRIELPSLN